MELSEKQKQKIKELAQKYDFLLFLLFGSQVGNKKYLHSESDIDLAFLSTRELSFEEEILLNTEFSGIFKTDRVETVNLKKASPLLLREIVNNFQILYEKERGIFDRLAIYAQKRFLDEYPYISQIIEEKLKAYK